LIKKYGGHEDQLSRKYWGMDRFRIKALVNLLADNFLTTEQTSLVVAQLQKKISIYLNGAIKRKKNDDIKYYSSLQAIYANGNDYPELLVS